MEERFTVMSGSQFMMSEPKAYIVKQEELCENERWTSLFSKKGNSLFFTRLS